MFPKFWVKLLVTLFLFIKHILSPPIEVKEDDFNNLCFQLDPTEEGVHRTAWKVQGVLVDFFFRGIIKLVGNLISFNV